MIALNAEQQSGVDSAIELLKQIWKLEGRLPIPVLRNEAAVLALIKEEPGQPVKYYMTKSGLSYRGFYNVLNALVEARLVSEDTNATDGRHRLLC